MQDQELLNKVITIKGKEEKIQGGKPVMKIKDDLGLTYTVYKTKQDGTESAAWKHLPDLEDTVQIGYVEQPGEYEGKAITYRTIRTFNKDIGNGVANLKAQSPRQERFSEGRDYDKENVGKCQSLFLQAYIQSGKSMSEALLQIGQAKRLAEYVVYGEPKEEPVELPVIQQEDMDVSDIPF